MRVEINDLTTGKTYVASSEEECRNKTDRSVYQEVVKHNDVITQGKVIGRPASEEKP